MRSGRWRECDRPLSPGGWCSDNKHGAIIIITLWQHQAVSRAIQSYLDHPPSQPIRGPGWADLTNQRPRCLAAVSPGPEVITWLAGAGTGGHSALCTPGLTTDPDEEVRCAILLCTMIRRNCILQYNLKTIWIIFAMICKVRISDPSGWIPRVVEMASQL